VNPIGNQVQSHNRRAWDERVRQCLPHTEPASDKDFQNPMAVIDECGWLGGNVTGKRVLCLAAGGGRHSVLFAAAGAEVTVVDVSPEMLALDRKVAAGRRLKINVVEASMDDLSMLPAAHFEIVIQPVSTCYVPDVLAVYREVARVTVAGAPYISQHKQPASLQAEVLPSAKGYLLNEAYYRNGPLPSVDGSLHRESGTLEFLHCWEELLGGLCRSGFVIEDLLEPRHANPAAAPGTFPHRSFYVPPYVTVKARRTSETVAQKSAPRLWTPGPPGR
jgi:SAM-dependent methyltransferase